MKIQDVDVIKNSVLPFNIKLRVVCGYGGLDEYLWDALYSHSLSYFFMLLFYISIGIIMVIFLFKKKKNSSLEPKNKWGLFQRKK